MKNINTQANGLEAHGVSLKNSSSKEISGQLKAFKADLEDIKSEINNLKNIVIALEYEQGEIIIEGLRAEMNELITNNTDNCIDNNERIYGMHEDIKSLRELFNKSKQNAISYTVVCIISAVVSITSMLISNPIM